MSVGTLTEANNMFVEQILASRISGQEGKTGTNKIRYPVIRAASVPEHASRATGPYAAPTLLNNFLSEIPPVHFIPAYATYLATLIMQRTSIWYLNHISTDILKMSYIFFIIQKRHFL